ncbi:MAG: hypothetical protein ACQEXX_19895 [Bacillota bacterium]
MKYTLKLIDGRLVIDMDCHDAMNFKSDGYSGIPERFELDELALAPVMGTVELSEEQVTKIKAEYENGGECDWCGDIASELSHPHMFDMAIGKKICRGCWDHDREVYKGSYGEDIGEFNPIGQEGEA